MDTSTRLAGHGLLSEGAAFIGPQAKSQRASGPGMGKCACGEMSEVLGNRAARKRWHRLHKGRIRAGE